MAAVREFLLAFADDEHLMGQQHTEWIGVAPFLEEDLAFSSIGQDELGHAAMLYELVLELNGLETSDPAISDPAIDKLAFGRSSSDYRSCHLVEYSTRHWSEALVRHWIYDTFEELRWRLLIDSTMTPLASVTSKALREEAFHRRHANALLDKLLEAPEARARIAAALKVIAPMVPGLCEPVAGEAEALAEGVTTGSIADLLEPLTEAANRRFAQLIDCGLVTTGFIGGGIIGGSQTDANSSDTNPQDYSHASSGRTQRSEFFDPLMTRMREVLDYDPTAVW